jgi:pyruvate formate lyase activating enzyme
LSGRQVSPQDVVDEALRTGGIGVAYTYNEPLISWEFVYDCAVLVREAGLKNVLVTNGFINRKPAAELLKLIDALNIDIKSMDNEFYVQQCGGRLQPVLDFAVQAKESGAHVEITNLLIPGLNSGDDQIALLAGWVAEHLGKNTPLHISAYFPRFEMKIPATGAALVQHACGLALRFLDNVYAGNI